MLLKDTNRNMYVKSLIGNLHGATYTPSLGDAQDFPEAGIGWLAKMLSCVPVNIDAEELALKRADVARLLVKARDEVKRLEAAAEALR